MLGTKGFERMGAEQNLKNDVYKKDEEIQKKKMF